MVEDIEKDPGPDQAPTIEIDEEGIEIAVTVVIGTEKKVVKRTENNQKTEKKRRAVKNIKSKDVDLLLDQTHDHV